MTLRIAVLGCLLAAAAQAQPEPITMHNDPMTFYNGSVQGMFRTRTFIPQINVPDLLKAGPKTGFPANFFQVEKGHILLVHGHPNSGDGQSVLVLQPSGTSHILETVKRIQFHDGDELHISLTPPGEIVIRKGSIPGAAARIPAHAHTPDEFGPCLQAVGAPMRRAAGASDSATQVTFRSTINPVPLGTQIVLNAIVTSAGAAIPAAQAKLWDNGANPITGPVQSGGRVRFLVTPAAAGDHCFAVAYPATGSVGAGKSAETCVRVLPAGCPVMSGDELQAQKVMAANVANTVWAIRSTSTKPWDSDVVDGTLKLVTVKYPDPAALMSSISLESDRSAKPPINPTPINPNCGAIHVCHMKDVVDKSGIWTLQPDCGPVQFSCHGTTYTWTPPNTSNQNTQSK